MSTNPAKPFDPPCEIALQKRPVRTGVKETQLLSASGHWSNCDLYLQAPNALLATSGARLVCYAQSGSGRAEVFSQPLASILATPISGSKSTLLASVRGHPANGYVWVIQIDAAPSDLSYIVEVTLDAWGTECTPEIAGVNVAATAGVTRNIAPPLRGGIMLADTGTILRTVACDADGALLTTSSGSDSTVVGTKTTDASHAAQTDALDTRAHSYARDPGGTWYAGRSANIGTFAGEAPGRAGFVGAALYANDDDGNFHELVCVGGVLAVLPQAIRTSGFQSPILCDTSGRLITIPGLPQVADTADAPTPVYSAGTATAGVLKNGAGWLMSLHGWGILDGEGGGTPELVFFCLVDKASAPANSDTIVAAYPIDPANTEGPIAIQLSRADFAGTGRRFGTGIAWCLSTTLGTVTLPLTVGLTAVVNGLVK